MERWGTAALDQRRKRTRDHLARIAPRRESWIKDNSYYYELLGRLFFGSWWNLRRMCYRFAVAGQPFRCRQTK
jgi:hypothetical protein